MLRLVLPLLLVFAGSCISQEPQMVCNSGSENYLNSNPIGTCTCEGHLYVSEDCSEGFYCLNDNEQQEGCYIKCDPDYYLVVDFINNSWFCNKNGMEPNPKDGGVMIGSSVRNDIDVEYYVEDDKVLTRCPVGGYNVCPSTSVDPPPNPEDVTENPLGTCRCNGELWVSEGCSYGFFCDDSQDIGGSLLTCGENEILQVDFEVNGWACVEDDGSCPLGPIKGVGCKQPQCEFGKNNLGECECDGQFFIDSDCNEGFYCTSNIPDPYLYDGCTQKCLNGQVLLPDIPNRSWSCVDKDSFEYEFKCPGTFHFECPATDVGNNFNKEDCECENQVLMTSDCRESFYCRERYPSGGIKLTCPPGRIVMFDFVNLSWRCSEELNQCPGLGGFKVGCGDGNEIEPPKLECEYGENTLGECRCNRQLFINEDCTKSFYCSAFNDEGAEGCHLDCDEGQVIMLDLIKKDWACMERPEKYVCPGEMQTGCPGDDFDVNCGCPGEVFMNQHCTSAFLCEEENTGNGNVGTIVGCPAGNIIDMDLQNPYAYECTKELDKCPQVPFNFGCVGGNLPDITTTPGSETTGPTDDPEATTPGSGSILSASVTALFISVCSFFMM